MHNDGDHAFPTIEMLVADETGYDLRACCFDQRFEICVGAVGFLGLGEDEAEAMVGVEVRPGGGVGVVLRGVAAAGGGWEAELRVGVALRGGSWGGVEFGEFLGEGWAGGFLAAAAAGEV